MREYGFQGHGICHACTPAGHPRNGDGWRCVGTPLRGCFLFGDGCPAQFDLCLPLQLVEQCLRFELKFESAGQFDGFEGEGAIQSRVTSSIPLRFTFASVRIEGQAPLVNENFSIIMTDDYFNVCQIENRRGGG